MAYESKSAKTNEILITDLVDRIIEGKERVADLPTEGHWMSVDYELEGIGEGRALSCDDNRPGRLTLRLGVDGYHRISFITKDSFVAKGNEVDAKLSGERCFRSSPPTYDPDVYHQDRWHSAIEVVWCEADVTGKDLILDDRAPMTLMAIRLTPVEPTTDPREVRWPMAVTSCLSNFGARAWETPDDVLYYNHGRIPTDSCVRLLIHMGANADCTGYETEVGTTHGTLGPGDWGASDGTYWWRLPQNMRNARKWGINPITMLAEDAHERGWEFYVYMRPTAWHSGKIPPGPSSMWWSEFFVNHPEYWCKGRDGENIIGMSLAYPEVRQHIANVWEEISKLGVDGVSPNFVRGTPRVFYEQPVVDRFRGEYGEDARDLPPDEPRWLEHVATYTTTYLREIREAIGDDCKLAPFVFGLPSSNELAGLDPAAWLAEGLIDDLIVSTNTFDPDHLCCDFGDPEDIDIEYYRDLPGREDVRIWLMGSARGSYRSNPEKYINGLLDRMEQGADGYLWWDADETPRERNGNIFQMGRDPRPDYEPLRPVGRYQIKTWDGFAFSYYSPIDSW